MKKIEFRSLSLVLGVILLLSAIVGCDPVEPSGDPSLTTGEGTAATVGTQATTASRTLPRGEITTEATTEATTGAPTSQPYWDGDALCFRAATYVQEFALSAVTWLLFRIEDGKIYLGKTLYEKVEGEESAVPVYSDDLLYSADYYDRLHGNQEISNTLQRIKESVPYCILKTNDNPQIAQIWVYKFDNVYYFLTFYGNSHVMRVHRAILDQEVFL